MADPLAILRTRFIDLEEAQLPDLLPASVAKKCTEYIPAPGFPGLATKRQLGYAGADLQQLTVDPILRRDSPRFQYLRSGLAG